MNMEPDFDEVIERRGKNSLKWDSEQDPDMLPMWVADMDFRTAPAVEKALAANVAQGIFGYPIIPPSFNKAIVEWWQKQYNCAIEADWILPVPGLLTALSAIIRSLLLPNEAIIIQPPVYNKFFSLAETGKNPVLQNNLIYTNGKYHIDFDDLEKKARDPATKLLLLCNPHNPVGRAWTLEELNKVAAICARHNVVVVSDEIHADLVHENRQHVSFALAAESHAAPFVICGSPAKAFGFSGLAVGYLFCPDSVVRNTVQEVLEMQGTATISAFAVDALVAAYTQEESWLKALNEYVYNNYLHLKKYCAEHMPGIKPVPLEATYLVWLDCVELGDAFESFHEQLINREKLWVMEGSLYGNTGAGFLRINIACPLSVLEEGLRRLEKAYRHIV